MRKQNISKRERTDEKKLKKENMVKGC